MTSEQTRPKFPNKEERAACWAARDEYWECRGSKEDGQCKTFRDMFEKNCSPTWVKYFDKRRDYLKFKSKMEKDGYDPVDRIKGKKAS